MAVEIIYKLICNDCKRYRVYDESKEGCSMRQKAKVEGWSYVPTNGLSIDFCPECTLRKQQKKKGVSFK